MDDTINKTTIFKFAETYVFGKFSGFMNNVTLFNDFKMSEKKLKNGIKNKIKLRFGNYMYKISLSLKCLHGGK